MVRSICHGKHQLSLSWLSVQAASLAQMGDTSRTVSLLVKGMTHTAADASSINVFARKRKVCFWKIQNNTVTVVSFSQIGKSQFDS